MHNHISWRSLWGPFLAEAVETAVCASRKQHRELSASASAIILSRASWEAFSNELIEQRSIRRSVKELSTTDKIQTISETLTGQRLLIQSAVWSNLLLVTSIRNSAVHSDTRSRRKTESPKDIAGKLSHHGVISAQNADWESAVFSANVARWCCLKIGEAIEALERIPGRQFRPPDIVTAQLRRILAPLSS